MFVISGAQNWCLQFGTFRDHFGTLGAPGRPWEQQEGHVGIQGLIFNDFGIILGTRFESFSGTEGQQSGVVSGFVSMSLLKPISFLSRNPDTWSSQNMVFVLNVLQKRSFSQKTEFWWSWGRFGLFF